MAGKGHGLPVYLSQPGLPESAKSGRSDIEQGLILPNIYVLAICQESPTGRQSQKANRSRTVFRQVANVQWRKRIVITRKFRAAPDIPTARSVFRWMAEAVERNSVECVEGYSEFLITLGTIRYCAEFSANFRL